MTIQNALASLAVRNLDVASAWYERVLGSGGQRPMAEVAEWQLPGGGGLQLYVLPERAGRCLSTLVVRDLEAEVARLAKLGIDTGTRTANERVKTLMVKDPDGNSLALAEALDPSLVK
jgi:catechol 2,3-dioxygenase-like lactoylglutathione lyase family enzyme